MTKTTFSVETLKTEAVRTAYAAAGATDLAVEVTRGYVAEAQKRVTEAQKRVAEVRRTVSDPKGLQAMARKEAKARQTRVEKAVADFQADVKAFPGKVETKVAERVSEITGTYTDLAKRGEKLVTKIRKQPEVLEVEKAAKTTVSKAKATTTSAKKTAASSTATAEKAVKASTAQVKKSAATTRSNAKATVTSARKTAAKTAEAVKAVAKEVG